MPRSWWARPERSASLSIGSNAILELITRFLVVGGLAFGGGQAALPLVERLAVADTGWLTPAQFAAAVGLSYATPGPVLILAAFIGYHVAAVPGAMAATAAVFAVPVTLVGFAAGLAAKLQEARWFQAFGLFAAAAAIGLLGVTLVALARPLADLHPGLLLGAATVCAAALRGVHPIILIAAATLFGAGSSLAG
jgi:chromate transporter